MQCTVRGTKSDGTEINMTVNKTYHGADVLQKFIKECSGHSGYDINIVAEDLQEYFAVDATVKKEWDDNNNRYGKRPDSISVQMYSDGGEYGQSVTLNEGNAWSADYKDMLKYSSGSDEINYTVKEVSVPDGYTSAVNGFTIINTYNAPVKTSVSVTKAWNDDSNRDGKRPESVTVNLLADGEDTGKTMELSEDNDWTGAFTELDMYKNHGELIDYTVVEVTVPGYTARVDGYNIANIYVPAEMPPKEDTPSKDGVSPQTGDDFNTGLYMVMMLIALTGIGVVAVGRRKSN